VSRVEYCWDCKDEYHGLKNCDENRRDKVSKGLIEKSIKDISKAEANKVAEVDSEAYVV
jgi:hypothetical protein